MKYRFVVAKSFQKDFKKLDKYTQKLLKSEIDEKIISAENLKLHGKLLKGKLCSYWSFRFGRYRLIAYIDEGEFVILVL
ncbi:MAG: type II toxin-antitoxin system RelE/ParE family toxin [Eggerthellaceae bacterium]|nr:type II toxin-antitoxin system RelE/ParE family toxin [Eggerthellaceae bacterium]